MKTMSVRGKGIRMQFIFCDYIIYMGGVDIKIRCWRKGRILPSYV
jgi:hypothetical protein